ncbi:xanthine dehydrogenase family protein subunit M [Natrarchaeobius halalkaliphilus]|uniref:Xanthine dehydrogenase family protein subunit M n=1 Tax=Natrarchaeobius halalkaliphilus TaxID=1679091 RepID=A0A3N6M098_9EURY|nr:xanthine dehydrogenase family protein subunit M [Natrarchaeobius halalkaliphilus]RQG89030.1 xanthine dehydrogenase family protein subunit M [Natrarchaeobius halalkaliphilus]
MYPAPFEYVSVESTAEAVDSLSEYGDREVTLLAGGHSLLPTMKSGLSTPEVIVDLASVESLYGIDHDDGVTRINAMTEYAAIERDETLWNENPVVPEAAAEIADVQVRNMGTIGGNIAHSDPAADLPAAVLAADATIHALGPDGRREIPAANFFEAMFTTALADGELLTAIDVPHLGENDAAAYVKKASASSGYALVGVAAVLETDGEEITDARVAANGAFDHAMALEPVETELVGGSLDDDGVAERAAAFVTDDVESYVLMDDEQASGEFREHLLEVYTERALETTIARVDGGSSANE